MSDHTIVILLDGNAQIWSEREKIAEIELPPGEGIDWLWDRIVEQELARDHRDTIDSIRGESYPI